MVKLFCAIVDVAGRSFPVDIDASQSVGDLKDAIKVKKMYQFPADELNLFLAKKGGGAWLESGAEDVKRLKKGEKTAAIEALTHEDNELQEESDIKEVLMGMDPPSTNQIHVLVVVPEPRTSASIVSHVSVFDRCSNPFFSQLSTVEEADNWLRFPSWLPLTYRRQLYVRSSYKVIIEQALMNSDASVPKYAVITGTPGTGKSVFVYYVMWRLVKDQKRVLFFSNKGPIYFDGSTMFQCKSLPNKFDEQFWSPKLWCLVDSVDPTAMTELPIGYCSVLLACTSSQDCISKFKKLAPTPQVFYMPPWTKEELTTIAPLFPDAAAVWQNRFHCLGGVPRLVLQDIETDPQALLMSACCSCSLDDCIMLVSIYSEINSKTKIAQTLIHIHSQEPYREYKVVYASELAMQVIAQTKWHSDRVKIQSLLGSCDGNPLVQSLCGYIFEPHAINLLEQGGSFIYRELLSGVEMQKRDNLKRKQGHGDDDDEYIEIPRSSKPRQVAEQVTVGQVANQLYVPRTSNYTAIDAWIPQFGGFQMTAGKKHDIKGGAADDLAKLGPNGNQLFFLLPPLYYKSFTKKTPQTIKQFAILVPYPEEV